MTRRIFILSHDQARQGAMHAVAHAPNGYCVTVSPKTRSLEANARMWAMLTELSNQVEWYGKRLTAEEWKCVMTAGLKKAKVVPGIDGGFVVVGMSTSQMSGAEISELMALIEAFGAEQGVRFEEECPA